METAELSATPQVLIKIFKYTIEMLTLRYCSYIILRCIFVFIHFMFPYSISLR